MLFILRVSIIIFMTYFSASIFAGSQRLNKPTCTDVSQANTQCSYEVRGQVIGEPESLSTLYGMTNMPYALCSSAVCKVQDDEPSHATCVCRVYGLDHQRDWRKASVGPLNYAASQPAFRDGKLDAVTSNFSFANFSSQTLPRKTTCRSKHSLPWANCFGVRCHIVAGSNPYEPLATCDCPIVKTNEFISVGPTSQSACKLPKNKVWSGATIEQGQHDMAVMQDVYKRQKE